MCDPDKVATAVHIERPDTKSKLRKFLGAVGGEVTDDSSSDGDS